MISPGAGFHASPFGLNVDARQKNYWLARVERMFGWFRQSSECPIDAATRQWIDYRWQWLTDEFGLEKLRQTQVIRPILKYFPDNYKKTPEDATLILNRICQYMGIDPDTILISFYEDRNPVYEGHFLARTSGLYHPENGKFRVWVEVSNLDDPLSLVGTMAHELGHVHLLGHGRISEEVDDHEPLTDLLTVFFGLGIFTANSVIREKTWHKGSLSGWSMSRKGYLGMPEYGYAFARFARDRKEDGSDWSRELRLGVRTAFNQSMRFLSAETEVK